MKKCWFIRTITFIYTTPSPLEDLLSLLIDVCQCSCSLQVEAIVGFFLQMVWNFEDLQDNFMLKCMGKCYHSWLLLTATVKLGKVLNFLGASKNTGILSQLPPSRNIFQYLPQPTLHPCHCRIIFSMHQWMSRSCFFQKKSGNWLFC